MARFNHIPAGPITALRNAAKPRQWGAWLTVSRFKVIVWPRQSFAKTEASMAEMAISATSKTAQVKCPTVGYLGGYN